MSHLSKNLHIKPGRYMRNRGRGFGSGSKRSKESPATDSEKQHLRFQLGADSFKLFNVTSCSFRRVRVGSSSAFLTLFERGSLSLCARVYRQLFESLSVVKCNVSGAFCVHHSVSCLFDGAAFGRSDHAGDRSG